MFKNVAADLLGFSDIGKILAVKDFDKTDVDEYIFSEDGEQIFVVIKSKTDEYCFTNKAILHLDGKAAISKKRTLYRYLYKHYPVSNVLLETAGTVDLDVEIKFSLGAKDFSIDIDKAQIEKVRDLYKALFVISERCKEIERAFSQFQQISSQVTAIFALKELPEPVILSLPDMINQTAGQIESHYQARYTEIKDYDFGSIYQRYLRN